MDGYDDPTDVAPLGFLRLIGSPCPKTELVLERRRCLHNSGVPVSMRLAASSLQHAGRLRGLHVSALCRQQPEHGHRTSDGQGKGNDGRSPFLSEYQISPLFSL
jgi:hypothetical protein